MADSDPLTDALMRPRRLIAIKPSEKMGDLLHVSWMLHNHCNQRCSYCRDFNWKGDFRWLRLDHVVAFLEKVFAHYRKDTYHISFTGGEPTLWPEFEDLCVYLRKKNCQIGLTSNGARRVDYWQRLADHFNWVCLSYHPEFTKDEHFLEVVQTLVNKSRLAVRIMMHKEKRFWDRSIEFAEKLKVLPGCASLFVEYVPLQDDFGLESRPAQYESWQNEFFAKNNHFVVETAAGMCESEHWPHVWDYYAHYDDGTVEFCRPNVLVANNEVNFKGWTCHAGLDLLFINHQGIVTRGACKQGGELGHIFDADLVFPSKPLVCGADFCPCGTDILIRKERPSLHG